MVKLIITDLDNTLLDKNGSVTESTIQLLDEARKHGTSVTVATGRSFASARGVAERFQKDTPVICYNGAMIVDIRTGDPIFANYLDRTLVWNILEYAREHDLYVQMYDKDTIVVEKLDLSRHPDPDLEYAAYREVSVFEKDKIFDTPKMLLAMSPELVPVHQKELESLYGEFAYFSQSDSHLIEIVSKGCDKGSAVKFLADYMGIKKEELMGCGDNTNDIPLIQETGIAVAVANAVPELKEVATYVCKGERNAGFDEAVRKFVLNAG